MTEEENRAMDLAVRRTYLAFLDLDKRVLEEVKAEMGDAHTDMCDPITRVACLGTLHKVVEHWMRDATADLATIRDTAAAHFELLMNRHAPDALEMLGVEPIEVQP